MADFGCGDAKVARAVPHKVHSFDLVPLNNHVTACDMANVSLALLLWYSHHTFLCFFCITGIILEILS